MFWDVYLGTLAAAATLAVAYVILRLMAENSRI